MKILLIDDNADYFIMTKRFLARSDINYTYTHISDFSDGLDAVRAGEHDVYLLDHQIGQYNGLDLIKAAIDADPDAICIMVTNQGAPEIEREAIRLGAADYIEKVISDPNYLDQIIRKAVHRAEFRRSQRDNETNGDNDDSEPFRAALAARDTYIEQLTILRQVDEELSQIANSDRVLSLAIDACMRLSGATAGFIGLSDEDQQHINVSRVIGKTPAIVPGDTLRNIPLYDDLLSSGEAQLVRDVKAAKAITKLLSPSTRTQMLIPLNAHERVLGLLCLESDRSDRFTQDIFDFIQLIASRIGIAVENALLYQVSQDQLAELQLLYNRLSQLEQLKSDMIRMAAHDLRNPIGVIRGYVQLLRRVDDPERREGYLQTLEATTRQMTRITTDILSLERIEQMQTDGNELVDLVKIVKELITPYYAQAEIKSQTLVVDMVESSICVLADGAQMHEAIGNLVSNALKYTPEGGHIAVRVTSDAGMAVVEVEDNGYGILESQQSKLFQPFFRAKSDETIQIEGTGLGLYLIKSIAERFGGHVVFQSEYGVGSLFGIRLPLA